MTVRYYSSVAPQATLTNTMNPSDVTAQLSSTIGLPGTTPFTLALDYGQVNEELVEVTNLAGSTATVTRAIDGTSAGTHSAGAFVRHVTSARDFADSRSHENAAAGIHGLSMGSALVGTNDTQTLTNKTLSAPTINGGALNGTFTGTPTFTNNVVVTMSSVLVERAALTDNAYRARVSGDTNPRFLVDASGKITWGAGGLSAGDTTLYRSAADTLTTDDTFQIGAAGTLKFGSSGDSNLYRIGANALQTDGTLNVVSTLTAGNFPSGSGASWTPAWTTSSGLHTPSFGNTVIESKWIKLGRVLFFSLGWTFGSTTNFGAGATTSDNWQFSLPGGLTADPVYGANAPVGAGLASATGGATAPVQVRIDGTGQNFILDIAGGRVDGTAIANTGTLDSLSPWTWASGNAVRFTGTVITTT